MPTPQYTILVVCTANRCRSPLAAALLRDRLAAAPDAVAWRIDSAGLHAVEDFPATALTVQAAAGVGLALDRHRAQRVDDRALDAYTLILTMEVVQAEALRAVRPDLAARIRPFSLLVGLEADIHDPTVDGTPQAHQALARQLARYVDLGLPRLRQWCDAEA